MVHGYHVIVCAYGFWLPNDPRGSWSEFVGKWELVRFGKATKGLERLVLTEAEERNRQEAKRLLKYPPVQFTGVQARAIGHGFANACRKSGFTIWACAILPEHTHLVIARHTYKVENIANLLKGEGTKQLRQENLDPMAAFAESGRRPPSPWADRRWKVFLDSEEAVENAIRYVEQNPVKEGKTAQKWSFVTPFCGLPKGGYVTYH
jgi:REP element-mobilizing transposase RayT